MRYGTLRKHSEPFLFEILCIWQAQTKNSLPSASKRLKAGELRVPLGCACWALHVVVQRAQGWSDAVLAITSGFGVALQSPRRELERRWQWVGFLALSMR